MGAAAVVSLRIAAVIPSFRRGSGGHATIVRILEALRARGHEVGAWLEDNEGRHARERPSLTARSFKDFFDANQTPLHTDWQEWRGADVALATGWQTVARVLELPDVGARAYLVQDHEPDFYPVSAERMWAADTYRKGLHCVAASEWLAELLRTRYGAAATHFDLALAHTLYRPGAPADGGRVEGGGGGGWRSALTRRAGGRDGREHTRGRTPAAPRGAGDRVVFYARAVTPRRAVPLGLAALAELSRRRPGVEIVLYGEDRPLSAPFAHTNAGVLNGERLAELYRNATVGMVFSLTNPSLICLEMMACGLPCVELASESMLATFGSDGPLTLAEPDPRALCEAIEQLLDDPERRSRVARAGIELMAQRTWERAAEQVEAGVRKAVGA